MDLALQLVCARSFQASGATWNAPGEWATAKNELDRARLLNACPVALRERVNLGYQHFRYIGQQARTFTFFQPDNAPFQQMLQPGETYRLDMVNSRPLGRAGNFERVTLAEWFTENPQGDALVVRAGGVGDLLFMTPGLREIKRRFPEAKVHLAVLAGNERVFTESGLAVTDMQAPYETAPHEFVMDLNYWVELAKGHETVSRPRLFAGVFGVDDAEDWQLSYATTAEEREWAREMIGEDERLTVVVQPHGSCMQRHCTAARMVDIIAGLRAAGLRVVTLGNYAPAGGWGADLDLIGETNLAQCGAIIDVVDAYLGMDSGLTHLANGLRKETVALCGPMDAQLTVGVAPHCRVLQGNQFVGCGPCHDRLETSCYKGPRCLENIPVELIVQTALEAAQVGRDKQGGVNVDGNPAD